MKPGNILFKATGIMTKRMRMKTCAQLGETLTEKVVKTGEKVNAEDVSLFLNKTLGLKRCKNIVVSDNAAKTREYYQNDLNLDILSVSFNAKNTLSSAGISYKTGRALLDLRISDMNNAEAINTAVHETQHLLYRITSFKMKIAGLIAKLFPKGIKQFAKEACSSNDKMLQYELRKKLSYSDGTIMGRVDGESLKVILEKTGCKDLKELRELLRNDVSAYLSPDCEKQNWRTLKLLENSLKDERNSYYIGGLAEKHYDTATGIIADGDTKSETLARLYEETIPILRKEARKQRRLNIKKHLMFKSKKVNKPEETVSYAKVPSEKNIMIPQKLFQENTNN